MSTNLKLVYVNLNRRTPDSRVCSKASRPRLAPTLAAKVIRLQKRHPELAAAVERMVDTMLHEEYPHQ